MRVAAVYGANASGKSNFLDALDFVSYFIRNGYATGDSKSHIPVIPFYLTQSLDQVIPSSRLNLPPAI